MFKVFSAIVLTCLASAALADSCGSISNSDRRNYCFAKAKKEAVYCGSINDADLRNYCFAEVYGKSVYCGSIKDNDKRKECRASVG